MNPNFITGDWNITILQNASSAFNFVVHLTDDGRASGDITGNYVLEGSQLLLFGLVQENPIYFYGLLNSAGSLEGINLIITTAQTPYSWKGVKGPFERPINFSIENVLVNKKFRQEDKCCDCLFPPAFKFKAAGGNQASRDVDLEMTPFGQYYTYTGAYIATKLMVALNSNPDAPTLVLFKFSGTGEEIVYGGILHESDDSPELLIKGIRMQKHSATDEISVAPFQLIETH